VHLVQQPFYSKLNEKFQDYTKPEYGICAGATENLLYIFSLRDYLEPQFLFEKPFTQNYAHLEQFQQNLLKNCSLNNFNQFAEFSSLANQNLIVTSSLFSFFGVSGFMETVTPWLGHLNWSYVPFVRKFLALKYYTVAMPQFLAPYQDFAGSKTKPNE
jgi:hypothetical protein